MTQTLLFQQDASYILSSVELFNWGGFSGYHQATVDPGGLAIIGPTGSGKTTFVDGLMTLLCMHPKYNFASTGGHESDRDLVSYVRGKNGSGNGDGEQHHVLRKGKTVTAIAATLDNGEDILRLGVVFWFDTTSSATSDLKRRWFFTISPKQTLEHWLSTHQKGGVRALHELERAESGIWVYRAKRDYLARVREFFEVRENAFSLLNRAAGLKQLNSIDEIFRELVLDDTSTFDRAREVANSFDDLTEIHEELEAARRQINSLQPVQAYWKKYQNNEQAITTKVELGQLLPTWFGEQACKLWSERYDYLKEQGEQAKLQEEEAKALAEEKEKQRDELKSEYLQLGGSDIQTLEELIKEKRKNLAVCEKNASQYNEITRKLELSSELTRKAFIENQASVTAQRQGVEGDYKAASNLVLEHGISVRNATNCLHQLQHEYQEVEKRPNSNIPADYQNFRAALAQKLSLEQDQLPFVAELVQVKDSEAAWRGAIERAIGAHRLRILVPPEAMTEALRWVNNRNNRLHVRILEIMEPVSSAKFFDDGFARKLKYKSHPYRESVKVLIAEYDRHCVTSTEALRETQHAMTQQGMMSGRERHFDKQDQKRLGQNWQTGFDNRDRLAAIKRQIEEAAAELKSAEADWEKAKDDEQSIKSRLQLFELVEHIEFEQVDTQRAASQLKEQETKLARLIAPDSDVTAVKLKLEEAKNELKTLNDDHHSLMKARINIERDQQEAAKRRDNEQERARAGLAEAQRQLAQDHFPKLEAKQIESLVTLEQDTRAKLQGDLDALKDTARRLEQELVRSMSLAKKEDRGALSEVGTRLEDVTSYIDRLQLLTEEALPAKRKRFMEYLNRSSDEGVTQLLTSIDNEVSMIEERLDDVNSTLRRTDFQTGRYLQLVSSKIIHESFRTLQKAQKKLASSRFTDDEGESHYKALKHIVELLRDACEKHRTLAAKALLDPRFRLEFKVSVIQRDTGKTIEVRSGSQGDSGGEKEIIASYVLTASLSYALCPDGSSRPLFGTIVLDEAFSRSSHAVAGRIIAALKEFGLHALFITPNKEMRLLRNHTRSAIVVHRKGSNSMLAPISWDELDKLSHERKKAAHEVAG